MSNRYERFNEITFNAYCMTAINNAVKRGLRKKRLRAQHEIPLTVLDENLNNALDLPDDNLPAQDMAADILKLTV
jgi:DNA-directed RNA polymerase specialized sigma subunit